MLMLSVGLEVEDKLRRMLQLVHQLGRRHIRSASEAVENLKGARIFGGEVIDGLNFEDAILFCAYLERHGLRAGRDYGVYQCGSKFGVSLDARHLPIARPMIRDLHMMKVVRRIASQILMEWRVKFGKRPGDAYEAVDFANRIVDARNKLSYKKCPACGRFSGAAIKGSLQGDSYILYARRLCCNFRERVVLHANRSLWTRSWNPSPRGTSS